MIDNTFTAIDFETAHSGRHSICQVGLVRYENGMITKEIDMLVKPPDNYYYYSFIRIHGINPGMTRFKPDFSEIWYYIEPYIKDQHLVAHNASFDISCLRKTLEFYEMPVPSFTHSCTCNLYKRKGLAVLCLEHNIELNHHNALSDAKACASLYLKYINNR